jgi:ubiquinone/menaquinone biosynthesis C-methylase UbiE
MGHSVREHDRLTLQAQLIASATRRLLTDAGLAPGMRVLDVGCGVGDVALLAAELVGPTGTVVGVDRDPCVLEQARKRACTLGATTVSFEEGDFRALPSGELFDAVVGRLVLMFQPDPVAALRSVLPHLQPGGIVAFQEVVL